MFVKLIGVSALLRHEEDRRALVSGERLSVDEEFIALRLAAKDRVIVDDERASAFVFLEKIAAASPLIPPPTATRSYISPVFYRIGDALLELPVAHRVASTQDIPGVAVGVSVVADAAVAVEGIFRRGGWGFVVEEEAGTGEKDAIEKVAAGDRLVGSEMIVRLVV